MAGQGDILQRVSEVDAPWGVHCWGSTAEVRVLYHGKWELITPCGWARGYSSESIRG